MRLVLVLGMLALALPLATAHDDERVYRLDLPAGASAGPIEFHFHNDHRLLGIGVGGCSFDSVGALRIVTPNGNVLEATLKGIEGCTGTSSSVLGDDPSFLAAGSYAGSYAFELSAPAVIEIYASET